MIIKSDNQTKLEFGKGDICIAGGVTIPEGGRDVERVFVVFENQEPREIGPGGSIKASDDVNLDDFTVVMTFTKKKSIDVVIRQLEIAKGYMEGKT